MEATGDWGDISLRQDSHIFRDFENQRKLLQGTGEGHNAIPRLASIPAPGGRASTYLKPTLVSRGSGSPAESSAGLLQFTSGFATEKQKWVPVVICTHLDA